MDKSLYSRRSNLVIGFHGCDKTVVDAVVAGKTDLLSSTNDYDWLGNGIYFWENNEERAWQWAKYLQELKDAYEFMVELYKESGLELPQNTSIGKSTDLLIRKLDCAVVQTASHQRWLYLRDIRATCNRSDEDSCGDATGIKFEPSTNQVRTKYEPS